MNLIWSRLKNNKCPSCNKLLLHDANYTRCSHCDFKCSVQKFNKIIDDLFKKPEVVVDNFSELQNLGREEATEDFSDSKALDY